MLVLILSALPASSFVPKVAAEDEITVVEPGDLVDPEGTSQFFDAEALAQLLSEDYASLGSQPWLISDAQMAHKRVSALIERVSKASALDEQGCVSPFSYRHREEVYQIPPDLFAEKDRGFQQTPLDLADRAPEILVVEALATEPGVLDGELGTLVRFEVVEWLKRNPDLEALGDPKYFLASAVWLTLGDRTYCQRREGASEPRAGDRFVVFGFRAEALRHHFWTGNIFPLADELILPQPYPLMAQGQPVLLETLDKAVR